jgi:hypothetical protein
VLRLPIVSVVFAGVLLLPTTAAIAGSVTAVSSDCQHAEIRPRSIILTCADANWLAKDLHWYRWGPLEARGRGFFEFNDCIPSCSEGHLHVRRAKIVLRHPHWCRGQGVHVFVDAVILTGRPWHGQTRFTAGLACPLQRTLARAAPITLGR